MKCEICGEKCDGILTVVDKNVGRDVTCCSICFELWTNQKYDKLTKRIKNEE